MTKDFILLDGGKISKVAMDRLRTTRRGSWDPTSWYSCPYIVPSPGVWVGSRTGF